MYKEIIRYYRKGHRRPRGCVVGIIDGEKVAVGYSLYHRRVEKKNGVPFSKRRAVAIARGRAKKQGDGCPLKDKTPSSLWPLIIGMYGRCDALMKKES